MIDFIAKNISSIIVLIILSFIIFLSVRSLLKRKNGGGCGCGCSSCSMNGECHKKIEFNGMKK